MVRQLVSKVQGVNLIGALSDMAQEAFNGIGRANGAMHDWWKSRKRQKMLFIFTEAADGFGRAFLLFGLKGRQIEQRILFLLLRCQIPAHSGLTSLRSRWAMA